MSKIQEMAIQTIVEQADKNFKASMDMMDLQEENDRLRADIAELVAALRAYMNATDYACLVEDDSPHAEFAEPLRNALDVISKHGVGK